MGWVVVARSEDVPASSVVGIAHADAELVLWRDRTGALHAMDARCPHQWSHLAAEGVVDGDELVCTAHFWRFDGDGHGTKVNVKGRRDAKGDVAVLACREVGGTVEVLLTGL